MRKGHDGGKKNGGGGNEKKKKTDGNSGHYVIASSQPPERRPLERRTLASKRLMEIVASMSLPAVNRPNADRWNAARSCQLIFISEGGKKWLYVITQNTGLFQGFR